MRQEKGENRLLLLLLLLLGKEEIGRQRSFVAGNFGGVGCLAAWWWW